MEKHAPSLHQATSFVTTAECLAVTLPVSSGIRYLEVESTSDGVYHEHRRVHRYVSDVVLCDVFPMQVTIDGDAAGPTKLVTTPQRLLAMVDHHMHQAQQQQLPSGEVVQQVLLELQEDIKEYDTHVYSKLSKRDMYGRF